MIPDSKPDSSIVKTLAFEMPIKNRLIQSHIDRIASVVDPLDIGVVVCDGSDIIHYTNQAFLSMYEYDAADMVGKTLSIIFPGELLPLGLYGTLNGEFDTITKTGIALRTVIASSNLEYRGDESMKVVFFKDSTRVIRAKGALDRSEIENKALLNAIPDLMFIVKKDGTFVDIKAEDNRRLVVPPDQSIGRNAMDTLHGPLAERFIEKLDKAIETGWTQYFNYEISLNGAMRTYEARCLALSKDEALIIARDFTERDRAEKANMLLASIVESSDDSIISIMPDGIVTSLNPAAEKLYGLCADEVINHNVKELAFLGSAEEADMLRVMIMRGEGIQRYETVVHVKKDGRKVDTSFTISPMVDRRGNVLGASIIARDISGRKRAEEAIRVKNRDLGILNSIATAINSSTDVRKMLDIVLKEVLDLTEADAGAVFLADGERSGQMCLMSFVYRTPEGQRVKCRQNIAGDIPNKAMVYGEMGTGPDSPAPFENVNVSLGVPLLIQDKLVGIMALYASRPVEGDRLIELLNIGSQLGIAIENHNLFRKVRDTGRYLASIIREAPDAMLTVDNNGEIMTFNKSASRLLKYTAKEIIGKKVSELLPDGNIDLTAVKSYVRDFRSKDGIILQLSVSTSRMDGDDKHGGFIITLKDVSETGGSKIRPLTEKAMDTARVYTFESSTVYMFDRREGQGYLDVFADQVRHNVQGLCVTRQNPVKIRQRLGLEMTPMIWLTGVDAMEGEICIKPNNISGLSATLHKFMSEASNGFILIDGIEYLIARNGYETVLKFIHFLNDKAMISNCSLLLVVDPLSIGEQQYHLLMSEMRQFKNNNEGKNG